MITLRVCNTRYNSVTSFPQILGPHKINGEQSHHIVLGVYELVVVWYQSELVLELVLEMLMSLWY